MNITVTITVILYDSRHDKKIREEVSITTSEGDVNKLKQIGIDTALESHPKLGYGDVKKVWLKTI